ncbi:hypothetical protein [Halanaerobaculum tunisiense]
MFFLVPLEKIKELLPFGLVGGFVLAVIIQYLAVDLLKLWRFNVAFLSFKGIPIAVLLAWIPPVIVFRYFWFRIGSALGKMLYILFFALSTTAFEYASVLFNYRDYLNWNVFLTFALALVVHLGLGYYITIQQSEIKN